MPTPGLSLHGFMEEGHALGFLRNQCVVGDATDAELIAGWNDARGKLGPPHCPPRISTPNKSLSGSPGSGAKFTSGGVALLAWPAQ